MKQNETKTSKKRATIFYCEKCDYTCSSKYNFNRHKTTAKHKMKQNETNLKQKRAKTSTPHYSCEYCGKTFKSRTTSWRHKKTSKCSVHYNNEKLIETITSNDVGEDSLANVLLKIVEAQSTNQENMNKLVKQNYELIEKIANKPNVINNNCNNKMTINMYLNNECKNAMTLTDFVKKLHVTLEDLQYTSEHGYVKGISNIFAKQLQDLKPTERPIHCSDKKRMQFYVKQEDKWEKDKEHKELDKTIADVTLKQIKKIRDWEDKHPDFMHDENLRHTWNTMMMNTMGGAFEEERNKNKVNIKKEVSNIIDIKVDMKDD